MDETPRAPKLDQNTHKTRAGSRRASVFVLMFCCFFGLFLVFSFTPWYSRFILEPYLELNARATAWMLGLLGQEVRWVGNAVHSPRFSLRIERGCDALDPAAVFVAAVLAFPAPWRVRIPAAFGGAIALAISNLARIVALYFTGAYAPSAFDVMHHDIGQGGFIFLALAMWMGWAVWITRPLPEPTHDPA